MINDYSILGISETNDITIIKKAFRARVKDLHPDVSDESVVLSNHFLFVEVCNAYERLVNKAKEVTLPVLSKPLINNQQIGIQKHKDPAFVYYKTACKYYELVHPSHWNLDKTITINGKTDEENKLQKETMEKVKELVSLFPKSYYYFSIVVHDYPNSVWVHDSKEKMLLIEKRMKTYKKIIESFITWNNSLNNTNK
jgi:hypothetical protein